VVWEVCIPLQFSLDRSSRPVMSYQEGMGIPMFIVTGWVGAVGRMNFRWGIWDARLSAMSTNPSAESPNP